MKNREWGVEELPTSVERNPWDEIVIQERVVSDFEINEYALDKEWLKQPPTVERYAREEAEAKLRYTESKNRLEVVKAEVALSVRQDPQAYGFDKATDKLVEALVSADERCKRAQQELAEAKHEADILQGGCNALEHKKKALENLVTLHISGYYSNPKSPKQSEESDIARRRRSVRRKRKEG